MHQDPALDLIGIAVASLITMNDWRSARSVDLFGDVEFKFGRLASMDGLTSQAVLLLMKLAILYLVQDAFLGTHAVSLRVLRGYKDIASFAVICEGLVLKMAKIGCSWQQFAL
jgi:hypothetical protein